jgi:hypothetical protein
MFLVHLGYLCAFKPALLKLSATAGTTWPVGARADHSAIIIFPLAAKKMQLGFFSGNRRKITVEVAINHFLYIYTKQNFLTLIHNNLLLSNFIN